MGWRSRSNPKRIDYVCKDIEILGGAVEREGIWNEEGATDFRHVKGHAAMAHATRPGLEKVWNGRKDGRRRQRTSVAARAAKLGVRWPDAYQYLVEGRKIRGVDVEETQKILQQGWIMVDVRPTEDFGVFHALESVNVPLYRRMEGNSPAQLLKKLLLLSQGVTPLEPNTEFVKEALPSVQSATGVVLADAEGGSLQASTGFPYGKQCRSLSAAYLLMTQGGIKQGSVEFLAPGLNGWFKQGMSGTGNVGEWQFNSRTPAGASYSEDEDP